MPQIYRRSSRNVRPQARTTRSYYRPARKSLTLADIIRNIKKLPKRFLLFAGALVLFLALGITGLSLLLGGKGSDAASGGNRPGIPAPTPTATDPTVALPSRNAPLSVPLITPQGVVVRDVSFGSRTMKFKEKSINSPAIFGNEVFYSAGTGSLESKNDILKKLYIYDLNAGTETKITETKLAGAGIYETQINADWLVWLETDHYTFNYVYMMNRKTGETTRIKNCKNGPPKLRLAGDTLVWTEPVDKDTYQLMMFDLNSQENLFLAEFSNEDSVTYGLMAPGIYVEPVGAGPAGGGDGTASPTPSPTPTPTPTPTPKPTATPKGSAGASASPTESAGPEWVTESRFKTTIVWSKTDTSQTSDQKQAEGEHSTIYWLTLGEDAMNDDGSLRTKQFSPKTYVNAPQFNGKYFIWSDRNFAPNSNLYISEPNGTPRVIDSNITTFSLGDGIVVYGKSRQVWVYVIGTGEYCRLTGEGEDGMLPYANGKSVVWYDKTGGGLDDSLRYKVLTDQDVTPGGQ